MNGADSTIIVHLGATYSAAKPLVQEGRTLQEGWPGKMKQGNVQGNASACAPHWKLSSVQFSR